MKKRIIIVSIIVASFFLLWIVHTSYSSELKSDANASRQLDVIRKKLGSITKMMPIDAKKHYENALSELNELIKKYTDTEEALEAKFYMGVTYNEMGNFEDAVKCFDYVLSQDKINPNFKARLLFFKVKALLGSGDTINAKEAVEELRLIEPRAANTFGRELGGMVRIGMEAPSFKALDLKGNPVSLSEYKGNIVVIDFWATWYDPCIQEFPKVKEMYRKFEDKGVKFIGISLDDVIEDLKSFVEEKQIEWPQVYEGMRWKGKISKLYNVQKIPMMFVLDQEGKVRHVGSDMNKITQIVSNLLFESMQLPVN
ncbi:MAG: redoxin domain-containing protein [Candidatus Scalinduaceae bacterium]